MKELDPDKQQQDKEIKVEAQYSTLKLISQQVFQPGLPLWQLNVKTKVIEEAKLLGRKVIIKERPRFLEPGVPFNTREVVYDVASTHDLVFVQAINKKNAARKFGKAGLF